jgi:hypothetical protein
LAAAPSRPKISRRRSAFWAWIPDFEPVAKNLASPLCLKLRITIRNVTYNVTGDKMANVQGERPAATTHAK